jgi:zinc/manganese transport system substrate-binding protein
VVLAVLGLAGPGAEAASTPVSVVAAEDSWGSIARQLGGEHAEVTSLIADPDTDAHDYEAKPSDGVAVAKAQVAIVNGIGYDGWMTKLLAANPSPGRKVVTVGDVVGVKEGGNPHQWYSPRSVNSVIDAVTEALKQADPGNAGYFDAQRQAYRTEGLKRYNDLLAEIRARYGGVEVGASESIFTPLADELGLRLVTPESFIEAISEGNEPTAKDKATVDKQISGKQIKVFVYNAQNSTPDVEALVDRSKKAGIPVVTVTETLVPQGASFQDWQANQLQTLVDGLARSAGTTAPSVGAAQAPGPNAAPAGGDTARSGDTATSGDAATSAAAAPTASLTRTGAASRWLAVLAGAAFVLGGLGVIGGAAAHRNRSPLRGA